MNGIFAIEKPSGISSSQFLLKLQNVLMNSSVFSREIQRATAERMQQYQRETGKKPSKRKLRKVSKVKMGHGGTLDPLASGVLVVGVGTGTKKLSQYLSGTVKVYESEALFGVSTTSGDVEGEILSMHSVSHLKMDDLKSVEKKMVGSLKQTPPIFAALKMNGKPLHEYAREGIPLPRAIEPRQVEIYDLEVFPESLTRDHTYKLLRPATDADKEVVSELSHQGNLLTDKLFFSKQFCESQGWESEEAKVDPPIALSEEEMQQLLAEGDNYRAPLLHFKAKVSSGTYIRSLISDIGKAMRSSCYMVKLVRCQQQEWALDKRNVFRMEDFTENDEAVWTKVLEQVLEQGSSVDIMQELADAQDAFKKQKEDLEQQLKSELQSCSSAEVAEVDGSANPAKRPLDEDDSNSEAKS
ncbi:pseudouridine synthase PUS4 [Lachancea thermotolerans CBS 6340]|uniref:tRNA pseudouridine(55) synthase n=1 Tax=Lachancea thermotolerans (strain ATCC 56472 / CBS 6340 / NRRL Y-8284) TaxID=559295 RepID=C5DBC8_LACTC|nr:KLTH0A01474p [Lachancea thermotolerans CBS 6340]CAR21085.1 KLTH0A01474p [Lachancea thermotolerans CBS 6340]